MFRAFFLEKKVLELLNLIDSSCCEGEGDLILDYFRLYSIILVMCYGYYITLIK
jgi:hypothetical protein